MTQVKLLHLLSHPHITAVEAIFVQTEPYAAYFQLPYYSGGDMLSWLTVHQPEMWQRKALLGQLCEALHHIHDHGVGHGDVKLQNVLVSLEGERATAHLADFESARVFHTPDATRSMSVSTSGGSAFTELYVAPELLAAFNEGRQSKPTAAGDMFSFGVSCLFACCLHRQLMHSNKLPAALSPRMGVSLQPGLAMPRRRRTLIYLRCLTTCLPPRRPTRRLWRCA